MKEGQLLSKAMRTLTSMGSIAYTEAVARQLRDKHPQRTSLDTSVLSASATLSTLPAEDSVIRRYLIRKAREQPAAGPSGMGFDILTYLTSTSLGMRAFRIIANRLKQQR